MELGIGVVIGVIIGFIICKCSKSNTSIDETKILDILNKYDIDIKTNLNNVIQSFSEVKANIQVLNNNDREILNGINLTSQQISQNSLEIDKQVANTMNVSQNEFIRTLSALENTNLESQMKSMESFKREIGDKLYSFETTQKYNSDITLQHLENVRNTVKESLDNIAVTNAKKLDEMREVVDERLQKTLEDRLQRSFNSVVEQLERVQNGLGEMQTLASDVGNLKKVLSNVKTRGILGEIQLGAILEEILAPEQYDVNVVTVSGSNNPVEFAIKMPGVEEDSHIYLPVDSKFPMDTYQYLLDAFDTNDKDLINTAWKNLENRLKSEAKDIREKYVHVPETTDFAIMFLPTEGLYAEAVRHGMVEILQKEKIMIAGPTTMAALLNSLQMGFKTLAIQKSSSEVWEVLGHVKSEFETFEEALIKTQKHLRMVDSDLDNLVGRRTRVMMRKLSKVTSIENDKNEEVVLLSDEIEDNVKEVEN